MVWLDVVVYFGVLAFLAKMFCINTPHKDMRVLLYKTAKMCELYDFSDTTCSHPAIHFAT